MIRLFEDLGADLRPELSDTPVGTPVEKSDRLLQAVTKKIDKIAFVESTSFFSGTTKDEISESEVGEHIGKITINREKSGTIKETEELVIANIRGILNQFTDLDYNISRPVLFSFKAPVEVIVRGYNLDQLRSISSELHTLIDSLIPAKEYKGQ